MSRPKPHVLLSHIVEEGVAEEVVTGESMFGVLYRGEVFNLRVRDDYGGTNYIRCSFVHAAHAHRLAARLNLQHRCDDFAVYEMQPGRVVQNPGDLKAPRAKKRTPRRGLRVRILG